MPSEWARCSQRRRLEPLDGAGDSYDTDLAPFGIDSLQEFPGIVAGRRARITIRSEIDEKLGDAGER